MRFLRKLSQRFTEKNILLLKSRLPDFEFLLSQQKVTTIVPKGPWLHFSNVLERCLDNLPEGLQVNFRRWRAEAAGNNTCRNFYLYVQVITSAEAFICDSYRYFYQRHYYRVKFLNWEKSFVIEFWKNYRKTEIKSFRAKTWWVLNERCSLENNLQYVWMYCGTKEKRRTKARDVAMFCLSNTLKMS